MDKYIAGILFNLIQLWANHANKPPGWVPTQEDVDRMLATIDSATPENVKAEARERLGIPHEPDNPA